jgi:hypothetical protein
MFLVNNNYDKKQGVDLGVSENYETFHQLPVNWRRALPCIKTTYSLSMPSFLFFFGAEDW